MAMGLASGHDLELEACQICNPRKVEKDYEQNLPCYPCSQGTHPR